MSHASLYSLNVFQTLNNPFVRLSAHSFLPESHVPEGWITVTQETFRSRIKSAGEYIKCDFPQTLSTNVRILVNKGETN